MGHSVLLIGNFLSTKGWNRTSAEELAEHLCQAGYSVIVASHLRFRLMRLFDMIFTTWMHKREYQVAYIEIYSDLAFFWGEMVCGLLDALRIPYILALHGGNLPVFSRRWPNRVKRLFKHASVVTAPSRYLQKEMHPYRSNIYLLPNPLDIELYTFHLRSNPKRRIVWLRAFHTVYNPQMAPRVIVELRKPFPEILLLMMGPDKGDGSLQETRSQIEEFSLQENIEIIDGVTKAQVPNALNRGDIFINTTNIDNTPVSVMEAMACGLCIVSTNVGGIPYLLEDGEDALLVPPNDVKAMSGAITRILTEPGLAAQLSQNARRKAEQFDWSLILPKWETLFEEVINA